MSAERDPFELLPLLVEPDPDPALMDATIAQSREAFRRSHALGKKPQAQSWLGWLKAAPNWLMPAAAGVAALVIAVAIAPGLISTMPTNRADPLVADRPEPIPSPTLSRGNDQVAEAPTQSASPPRMGMQPGPGQRLEEAPALVSTFQGDGVIVGSRLSNSMLELTLPELTGEQIIDSQMLLDGEEIEILAAFRSAENDFVAVQLRVNDERFWRIYTPVSGSYQRDVERSELVSDAQDQVEVTRRLTGQ